MNVGLYLWPAMTRLSVMQNGRAGGDFVPLTSVEIR